MNQLVEKIKELSDRFSVAEHPWGVPALPLTCGLIIPDECASPYARSIYLKENLRDHILSDNTLTIHYWIIQDWGDIGSFKKNEKNNAKIQRFLEKLDRRALTREHFDCISSLSKIASFIDPKEYAVYDSRAIYTLNWLLFNYSADKKLELFPQPIGRGPDLRKFDMQTIFRLAQLGGARDFTYMSHQEAFHRYNTLLKQLAHAVFGLEAKPYRVEMLLYMIAPTFIVSEIEKNVSIKITSQLFRN
nr:hypothetical protein [uncultured Massilia sp.]